jgi:ribonuclease PH
VFDLKLLGERTIQLDCDVIQADGGTRTASHHRRVGGGAGRGQLAAGRGKITATSPILGPVAAISVGIVQGVPLLDLDYVEDWPATPT